MPELTPQWSRSASAVESGRCGSTRAVVLRSSPSPAAPRPRGADARIEVAGTTHSGYGCGAHAGGDTLPLVHGGPRCRTVFFIDARSGRRVGMTTATAERLLRQRVIVGCMAAIRVSSRHALLTVAFAGGTITRKPALRGGHVSLFALHGDRHDPGLSNALSSSIPKARLATRDVRPGVQPSARGSWTVAGRAIGAEL